MPKPDPGDGRLTYAEWLERFEPEPDPFADRVVAIPILLFIPPANYLPV
jgi:hypothetical protein